MKKNVCIVVHQSCAIKVEKSGVNALHVAVGCTICAPELKGKNGKRISATFVEKDKNKLSYV
jgi:hypothetical protein